MPILLRKRAIKWYGAKKQLPDQRDRRARVVAPVTLPKTTNLGVRVAMPPVYDQGALGSCTANAIGGAFEYELRRQKFADFAPSRLAIYYGERVIEGTVNEDAGAELRDGMKVIAKEGTAPETLWPYRIARFREQPPAPYYAAATKHLCVSYEAVEQTERGLKTAMAAGYPVVFGMCVYESFESDTATATGRIPMPRSSEALLGGHAVLMSGYTKTLVGFRNSWGDWGRRGYGTLPLDFVLNPDLAWDFWIVKVVQ